MQSSTSQTRILKTFLFTSLLYLSAPAAQAAGDGAFAKLSFAEIDRNHDGAIDAKEAAAVPALVSVFSMADTNQDGVLSEAEFKTLAKQMG